MKRVFWVLLLLILPLVSPVSAHRGGVPIVKINNVWVPGNPIVNYVATTDLTIAADLAPQVYRIGDSITIAMNEAFIKGADGKNSMRFRWDFGDKTPAVEGQSVSHVYTVPGSHVITVLFAYPTQDIYYPSDNVLIHIVPSEGYALPRAQIKINGSVADDRLQKAVPFLFHKPVSFDGSGSTGHGLTYHWDFGDRSKSETKTATHTYKKSDNPTYLALLRVTDENQISSDAAVFLTEGQIQKTAAPTSSFLQSISAFFANLFKKR